MRIGLTLLILLSVCNLVFSQSGGEEEQQYLRFKLDTEGYFYNAEFSHPLKPGYTLPGFIVQPSCTLAIDRKFEFTAGYFGSFIHGREGIFRSCPILSLGGYLFGNSGLYCALGTLPISHPMLEFVYSCQYAWLHRPEAGAQIRYDTQWFRLQTWIDWDHFIWKDANDEERFLFGAQLHSIPNSHHHRFAYNAFLLARHHGGQIDTSRLPVVTSTNIGLVLEYALGLNSHLSIGTRLAAVASHDGHKPTPLTQRNGWALRPEIWFKIPTNKHRGLKFLVSYFYGSNFISLRGEELYRSYSLWSDGKVQSQRQILQGEFVFQEVITQQAAFQFGINGYYDLDLRRIDYDFYLRLRLNLAWQW